MQTTALGAIICYDDVYDGFHWYYYVQSLSNHWIRTVIRICVCNEEVHYETSARKA